MRNEYAEDKNYFAWQSEMYCPRQFACVNVEQLSGITDSSMTCKGREIVAKTRYQLTKYSVKSRMQISAALLAIILAGAAA